MPRIDIALDAAAKVATLANAAKATFIAREDAIDAMAWGIVAGEHAILLGPPGTAKSAMVRFFAQAMDLRFFRRVLNPDTTREDLVGPLDPGGLRQSPAVWERCWSGLATAHFAFLDEVGKASNQVLNMLLDAMEERRVTSGDIDRPIPLHIAVGATNEVLDQEAAAVFDRFTLRVVVKGVTNANDFVSLLTSQPDQAPHIPFEVEELEAMRMACRMLADRASKAVVETMVRLWSGMPNVDEHNRVSDRRWKRLLTIAAARALMEGRADIEPRDLIVARHLLWTDIDTIDAVQTFVVDIVDAEAADIRAHKALVNELSTQAQSAKSLEEIARVGFRCDRLIRDIEAKGDSAGWRDLVSTVMGIKRMVMRMADDR